jgi:hypothetical protein
MVDSLIAAWLLLFLCSPLWIMFLVPFFARNPRPALIVTPWLCLGAGFLLGLFAAILMSKSAQTPESAAAVAYCLGLGTLIGGLAGLAMLTAGLLGMMVRHLINERQFTIKTGMVAVAAVGVLCGLIRLITT